MIRLTFVCHISISEFQTRYHENNGEAMNECIIVNDEIDSVLSTNFFIHIRSLARSIYSVHALRKVTLYNSHKM